MPALAKRLPLSSDDLLHDLRFTLVQLDLGGDLAEGLVQVDGASLNGQQLERALYKRTLHAYEQWLAARPLECVYTGDQGATCAVTAPAHRFVKRKT